MAFQLQPGELPEQASEIRRSIRLFLEDELQRGLWSPSADAWMSGYDPAFSARLGAAGWIGMSLPKEFGGGGLSPLDRFVVAEELLAAGAPVAAHWIADRQMAPSILRAGTAEQKAHYLPAITRGECFISIGMSEPDAGSDLASVRTTATPDGTGWRINGTKLWTTGAHWAHAMVVLVRTEPLERGGDSKPDRHGGLSQFLVDLPHPQITVNPIHSIDGESHFNEVVFDNAFVDGSAVLGTLGAGWQQVTGELAWERSGPERVLSTMPLLRAWGARCAAAATQDPIARRELGRLSARAWTLRQLSLSVASALSRGEAPDVEAALVKDLGSLFEGEVAHSIQRVSGVVPDLDSADPFSRLLARSILHAPGFTLRGGTNEILRSVVARGIGVR